jgi:hypothetical protein
LRMPVEAPASLISMSTGLMPNMTLGTLLVAMLVFGLLFWLVRFIPDATGQTVARLILVVLAVVWLLRVLGVAHMRLF